METRNQFRKLFEAVNIGRLRLKNRIVRLPMQMNAANLDGSVSDRQLFHYAEAAKGGCGLVIVEGSIVDKSSKRAVASGLVIDHDKYIPRLEELANAINVNGAKSAIQIAHTGRVTAFPESGISVSASDIPLRDRVTRALSVEEIGHMVEQFGEAARRAKVAGFDMVQIHGYAGYLVGSFLSGYFNKRTDKYGGNFENRMRFPLEIIKRVRDKVGDDYPLIFKFSVDEFIEGGIRLEEAQRIARRLEEAGINAIDANMGVTEAQDYMTAPMARPPGFAIHLAEGIKRVVRIPVIGVGRIIDPVLAERILEEGKADLIGMGRALIADPELPKKAAEGRIDDIRKCIGCNQGCIGRFYKHLATRCTINAAFGRGREFEIMQAPKSRNVFIVGGGPAGMEAARIAALRGHKVSVYEQSKELGGQLRIACIPPYRGEIANFTEYLSTQIRKLGVKIELGKKMTLRMVEDLNPDVVIAATGASYFVPDIPGIGGANVVLAQDVVTRQADVGKTVVVAGGGEVGCEVAEFLVGMDKEVTIVEMLDDVALDMEPLSRKLLLSRLQEHGVRILPGLKLDEINEEAIICIDKKWQKHSIKADTLVIALGAKAESELVEELEAGPWELYSVGDCVKPRKIIDAVYEGSYIGRQV